MAFCIYTSKLKEEILREFAATEEGLHSVEVVARIKKYGKNEIGAKELHWWVVLGRQLKSPFIYILFIASALSLLLGEKIDALMVLGFILINTLLGFIQEYHSEKSIKLLQQFVVSRARVKRDGKEMLIDSKELVPGDIVEVETGDIVPADLRFFSAIELQIDESALTGESAPVMKSGDRMVVAVKEDHQARNIGFSGTKVVGGKGVGVVIATGHNTQMGEVASLTIETHRDSLFEKGIAGFSRFILRMILIILVLLFVANIAIKGHQANVMEFLLFSIALAVSVIPEALPLVTTISLSKGALKMAKNHVVVKRLSAIEDLGSVEVLCSDKTGTLTENKMTVTDVYAQNKEDCLFYATLAASFLGNKRREPNNSFDLALWHHLPVVRRKTLEHYIRVSELPFDPVRRRNSVLVEHAGHCQLIVRGAPETIFKLCKKFGEHELEKMVEWQKEEGYKGNRVIAVAVKDSAKTGTKCSVQEEKNLTLMGLISFCDPLKKTAKGAIEQAERLGLRVKIVTGDSREVAGAIAHQAGLITDPQLVITAEELMKLNCAEQNSAVEKYDVFARVSPQEKFKIIQLLEEKHEVAFLGEGINDAPALKLAHVGMVVDGASDIARDAADIVLLNPSLASIVQGIKEGREIFANTVKYIKTTLISNFGNFYAVATASLIIPFLPMLPVQILLLNLLSDFPMIAIAADSVDTDELKRPRNYNVREVVLMAIILGLVSTIFDFVFFALFFKHDPGILQTSWFIGSVLTEIALIYSIRTHSFFLKAKFPSWSLIIPTASAVVITLVLPFTHFGQEVFHFLKPEYKHLGIIFLVVACYFMLSEAIKLVYYRMTNGTVDKRA